MKKGISLIVLIITIIVMVILAGAVIITMDNTDLIGQSKRTVNKTNLRQVQELAKVAWVDGNYEANPTVESLTSTINQALIDAGIEPSDYNIEVTLDGVTVSEKTSDSGDNSSSGDDSESSGNSPITQLPDMGEEETTTSMSTVAIWTTGSGTSASPYLIESQANLAYLAQQVNLGNRYKNVYFRLNTDLELTGEWIPIGNNSGNYFDGVFDGYGRTIVGLNITSVYDYRGLFGNTGNNSQILNLTVSDFSVGSTTKSGNIIGAILGCNRGTIDNCFADNGQLLGATYVGGIVGYNMGTISNSSATNLYFDVTETVGGLVGFNSLDGTVTDCSTSNNSVSDDIGENE